MMGKDFVVSSFVLKISNLANMNPEFILPNCPIYIFSGVGGMHAVSRSIQIPHLAKVTAFYRLIYFYYTFSFVKERQFRASV